MRVLLLLVTIAILLTASGLLYRVDNLVYDLGQRLNWRPAPTDVLIVAIDQSNLERLGRWPWPRYRHARLLRNICASKPAVVGINIAFSEPGDDASADDLLAEAIAECGNVVLPLVIEQTQSGGQLLETPPIAPLAFAAAGLGRIGVHLDEDGIARSVDLREGIGIAAWPLLAEDMLRVARRLPKKYDHAPAASDTTDLGHRLVRETRRRFEFVGAPGSFPRLSYSEVLDGKISPLVLAGKIVLVGVTAVGMGDALPTPVSALADPMPGVELQANVLLSMLEQRLITPLPLLASLLVAALLACVPMLWLPRMMALPGLLISLTWLVVVGIFCAILPIVAQYWFPPSGALVAGGLAFPLWSWRRLELARRHLDQELRQLRSILPESEVDDEGIIEIQALGFEERIVWVQEAQRMMQNLETQRNEALAFISHDLRAPLAGAVRQLESEPDCQPERLLPSLRRALAMAQAFLWLARAEALDRRQMKELELVSILHQAADDLYSLVGQRRLKLLRHLPDETVWIKGDFESLERSAFNLLHNALSYAPEETTVVLGLDPPRAGEIRFWVENDGPRLVAEQIEKLFQRFSRGDRAESNSSGTGLGLYFVRKVAVRHGGTAGVTSAGGKIRFWVRLPSGEPPVTKDGSLSRLSRRIKALSIAEVRRLSGTVNPEKK
ncbi:MAG TPA: CHASE2 and HATPase_c domain-containing protein [Accumulibacter sp.]|nr:CHASE2 domain-containing protein [Accumulibacter sp.]HMW17968.1 CHASE2 and HATPase_c domain-containing protein [Accumulibacter sp.]HMX23518.1 CHASE2 and HATPase_c domain-containing protein [Accumulibacter sp.]HND80761.1 CHASE2 and HATPase_c domain-containing protein [Accumulibacter sp.]HNE13229.1 CHASE2 and HATPase_c domain-containing protein [Accumulibacter sp.]